MPLKKKSICGLKSSAIKDYLSELERIVSSPKFMCGKCARVANRKCFLCKAKKLARS